MSSVIYTIDQVQTMLDTLEEKWEVVEAENKATYKRWKDSITRFENLVEDININGWIFTVQDSYKEQLQKEHQKALDVWQSEVALLPWWKKILGLYDVKPALKCFELEEFDEYFINELKKLLDDKFKEYCFREMSKGSFWSLGLSSHKVKYEDSRYLYNTQRSVKYAVNYRKSLHFILTDAPHLKEKPTAINKLKQLLQNSQEGCKICIDEQTLAEIKHVL